MLDELLKAEQFTDFQRDLFDALLLYSRSSLQKELADKLVYILVTMESMLLKNSNEPIQQNISERLAIFIGNSIQEKQEIIKVVKDIYALRSAFIHHGHGVSDVDIMTTFMKHTRTFFHQLILNKDRFRSKIGWWAKPVDIKQSLSKIPIRKALAIRLNDASTDLAHYPGL